MKLRFGLMVILLFILIASQLSSMDTGFKYIGVKKCKMCHNKTKTGKQYTIWTQQSHSKAYATLATDEAKEAAKAAGVAGDPQKAKECLSCHTTAAGESDAVRGTLTMEEGISCEACHGAGSKYKSMKIMKAIHAGTEKGITHGLKAVNKETCLSCHNKKSPTFKEFNFEDAVKKIAHPIQAAK